MGMLSDGIAFCGYHRRAFGGSDRDEYMTTWGLHGGSQK